MCHRKLFWVQDGDFVWKAHFQEWEAGCSCYPLSQSAPDDQSQWHTSCFLHQRFESPSCSRTPGSGIVRRLFLWCRPSGRKLWPLLPFWYPEVCGWWMDHNKRFTASTTKVSVYSAVIVAALCWHRWGTELGLSLMYDRTTWRTNNADAGQPRGHTSYRVGPHHRDFYDLARTLIFFRSSMMTPRPYETVTQCVWFRPNFCTCPTHEERR